MKLGSPIHLVLERLEDSRHRIKMFRELKDVLLDWKSSTRISPIFPVSLSGRSPSKAHKFLGKSSILLVGPIHPQEVSTACSSPIDAMWVGFGLLNVIVATSSPRDIRAIQQLAQARGIAVEHWRLLDDVIHKVTACKTNGVGDLGARLGRLSSRSLIPEVREALSEFCPLMASTLARSQHLPPGIRAGLLSTLEYIEEAIKDAEAQKNTTPYRLLGQLLMVNAGLSRFSSQTFAGTVPVSETECHFWTHSFLGIGVASIGLWKLTEFLEKTLGSARLPERFAELRTVNQDVPDLCILDVNSSFWSTDHIGQVNLKSQKAQPLVPLIAYFSARDGFRSTLTTISAPLASVASCNSPRWSLLTITHEISHIVVRGMLASLYPDFEDPKQIDRCLTLLDKKKGANLLEEITRLLFVTITMIDLVHSDRKEAVDYEAESFIKLLEHWQREVEEVLVHVFDFVYFYGKDVTKYINGIWASWGTIPNIGTRIPDYVVRTITTVVGNHLRRPGGEDVARELVVRSLTELQRGTMGGAYIQIALDYISNHWSDEIRPRVLARKGLVKIAQTFFFSESVATNVRSEPEISGGATEKEGYTLRVGQLDLKPIKNPLRFLELYSVSNQPSLTESIWIYYVLTFCATDKHEQ